MTTRREFWNSSGRWKSTKCGLTTDLSVGQAWWNEIERQISASHCFVLLLSPDSIASEYCQKELEFGAQLGNRLLPIMIEEWIYRKVERFQVINIMVDLKRWKGTVKLLNGLFEIEREVFNPLKGRVTHPRTIQNQIGNLS